MKNIIYVIFIFFSISSFSQEEEIVIPNLWPQVGSDAIGNGEDLGAPYNEGLDISSSWPDNVLTTPQLSEWSIGAYVVDSNNRVLKHGEVILIGPNNQVLIFNK